MLVVEKSRKHFHLLPLHIQIDGLIRSDAIRPGDKWEKHSGENVAGMAKGPTLPALHTRFQKARSLGRFRIVGRRTRAHGAGNDDNRRRQLSYI
jgi:hypothetical protein